VTETTQERGIWERRGKFSLPTFWIEDNYDKARKIFAECVIIEAFYTQCPCMVHYLAYSKQFEIAGELETAPFYYVNIEHDNVEEKMQVVFSKESPKIKGTV
jgi:hypothetical protein